MHYLAHSITKLCQGRKQRYEGWEDIPMYDCSGKEGIYRSSWVWISVCMPDSGCVWTAYGLVWDNRRLELRQGHRWPYTTWQGDSRCVSYLCNSCVWKQRRAASPRQRVGIDNYIFAWSLNLKQTLENAKNQVGKQKQTNKKTNILAH